MIDELVAIYCDDVRMEIGNKPSAMGMYMGHMRFSRSLYPLSKLSVIGLAVFKQDAPITTIEFSLNWDDQPIVTNLVPSEQFEGMRSSQANARESMESCKRFYFTTIFNIAPIPFHNSGLLQLCARANEGEPIKALPLFVDVVP